MKKRRFFILFLVYLISSCSISPVRQTSRTPEPLTVVDENVPLPTATPKTTIFFKESAENFPNPERGFAGYADLQASDHFQSYEEGYTLVHINIRLDEYREQDIPLKFLDEIDSWFSSIRENGVKAVLRFSYNDGPYPDPEPDASLEQILRHIQQLEPLLKENSDVIAWMEAGFIGAWGEWHTSTNKLDDDQDAKKKVLFSLLDALPSDRMVSLRYPMDIMKMFPTPLSRDDAYTGTYQSRVGFHNDCFLSGFDDEHTYARRGVFTLEQELDYLSQLTQFVPVGGESCAYNPPRGDCPDASMEVSLLHITELNDGWFPDVLDAWKEQGCYYEFQLKLGYRISLNSVTVNQEVSPGGILDMDVILENKGFASMVNPRPVYVVLDGPDRFQVELLEDPRFWMPGSETKFNARLQIPDSMPDGTYKLAIWLPDAYESLQNNPRYSVRFANEDVWDNKTGYNILGTVTIDSSLP